MTNRKLTAFNRSAIQRAAAHQIVAIKLQPTHNAKTLILTTKSNGFGSKGRQTARLHSK